MFALKLRGGGGGAGGSTGGKDKSAAGAVGGGKVHERIAAIEEEMRRTQKNKATEGHLGLLKAKLAKLRTQRDAVVVSSKIDGFECSRHGDARIALVGFPSVGKSTLFTLLTNATSEAAEYEFTTLTCIPGIITYRETKLQLLDLPGIIRGAGDLCTAVKNYRLQTRMHAHNNELCLPMDGLNSQHKASVADEMSSQLLDLQVRV